MGRTRDAIKGHTVLKEMPVPVTPTALEQLASVRVTPETHYKFPSSVYERVMNWAVLPCIDNWILNTNTGKVWVPIRNYEATTPGTLWPGPGGRIQVGETTEQAISRLFNDELGLRVNLANSQMIAIGYGVYWYNGRRQTPNYTFVHKVDLPEDTKFPDNKHFVGYCWVGPEDIPRLRENTQTIYPYVVQQLEAIFSGTSLTHGTLYHNEETGENVPENRMMKNVGEIQKDLRVRLVGRTTDKPDQAFQQYIDMHIPVARLEAIVIDPTRRTPQILFSRAQYLGERPVVIYGRHPYDERPEAATLRLAHEQTGLEFANPFTIGVKNEIYLRARDRAVLRHEIAQVRTLTPLSRADESKEYFWMDLGSSLAAIGRADPHLPSIIRRSGILEGRPHGPVGINDFVETVKVSEMRNHLRI